MDVGAGSGILSLFAAQAGAKKVYAVEASSMAEYARELVQANGFGEVIEVLQGNLEDITIPEKQVDILISEPLGTWLLNERMLETYIIARDRFLKKEGGKMFPSSSHLCIQPFYDEAVYNEQLGKATFWNNKNFYGLDLTVLKEKAIIEKFQQPLIDTYDPVKNLSQIPDRMTFDFEKCTLEDLKTVDFYFKHTIEKPGLIHGYSLWFDAYFKGSESFVTLQTGP